MVKAVQLWNTEDSEFFLVEVFKQSLDGQLSGILAWWVPAVDKF